jgi:hypothetical protein
MAQWLVELATDPQRVQQYRELARDGNYRPLLSLLAALAVGGSGQL